MTSGEKRTKVIVISAFFPAHGGGIEAVAGHLANEFSKDLDITWMAGGPPSEMPEGKQWPLLRIARAESINLLERRFGLPWPIWWPRSLLELWRHIKAADIVHAHDYLYPSSIAAFLFAILSRKPLVLTQHIGSIPYQSRLMRGVLEALNRTLGRLVLGRSDQVTFVGRQVMDYFGNFVSYKAEPALIPNGVNHDRYHPIDFTPDPDAASRLLFVGRFVEKKGVTLLKQCIDIPDTHWTFIGWGHESPLSWGNLPGNVAVFEHLHAADIVPHYQNSDLLILPSTGEGFPLVIQEALACGTPVLVSDEVRASFPVDDPHCVFEVSLKTSDPAASLRKKIIEIISQKRQLHEARKSAAELSRQWSWELCAETYTFIFNRLTRHRQKSFSNKS